eukprot:g135.t1
MDLGTRQIAEFIESKQYKKALKSADQNLKKNPKHGETLCLKGLTLRYTGKKEEAYELVKEGLKYGAKSYVCWHVYGLMHRHDKEYAEAIKCYKNALKYEQHNLQILRDLALLQLHERDLSGAVDTRKKLCALKQTNLNLIGYAVTEHMNGNPHKAVEVISDKSSIVDVEFTKVERSELLLYQAHLLEISGQWKKLLSMLAENEQKILDKTKLRELRGRILMYCGRMPEAQAIYKELYLRNPENHIYILCLLATDPRFRDFWPPLPAPSIQFSSAETSEKSEADTTSTAAETEKSTDSTSQGSDDSKAVAVKKAEEEDAASPSKKSSCSCCPNEDSKSSPSTSSTCGAYVGSDIDFASVAFGQTPESNAMAFPPEMHPAGSPVFGWMCPEKNSFLQKACYKRVGKRIIKQKRPYLTFPVGGDISSQKQKEVLEYLGELRDQKKSESAERVALFFLTGSLFQEKLKKFLRPRLEKGLPSLFRLLKPFYFYDSAHWGLIEETLLQMLGPLEKHNSFDTAPETADSTTPTSLLFLYQLIAEHYNILGDFLKALEYIDKAIDMAPTHPELYMIKGKILKDSGDLWKACEYLNTRAVKAMLRIDDCKRAQPTMILFSRDNTATEGPGAEAATNLHDMQCMWYEAEVARSYSRQRLYGRALRYLRMTISHFNDMNDDQFDFHNYCLRKNGLTTYTSMLSMQDKLYSHKFFRRAAKDAVKLYCQLLDAPGSVATGGNKARGGDGGDAAASAEPAKELTAAEKKKLKHAAKRQGKKAEVEKEQAKQEEAASVLPCTVSRSTDPNGAEYLASLDLTKEANSLVGSLLKYAQQDPHTFCLAYQVYSRSPNKSLLCAKMLQKLCALERRMEANFLSTAKDTGEYQRLEGIPCQSTPSKNCFLLSELAPCVAHFISHYLQCETKSKVEMQLDVLKTEVFSILAEVFSAMLGEARTVRSIADAKTVLETDIVPRIEGWKCATMKEHEARFRFWKACKAEKKFFAEELKKLQPDATWGPFEHFQKFERFLEMELMDAAGMLDQEHIDAFSVKCKPLFATPLKMRQQSIMDKPAAAGA